MSPAKTSKTEGERRGEVLEVARGLLDDGRSDDLLLLFAKLVEQNEELTTRIALATTRADAATTRAAVGLIHSRGRFVYVAITWSPDACDGASVGFLQLLAAS